MSAVVNREFNNKLKKLELRGERNEAVALAGFDDPRYDEDIDTVKAYLLVSVFFSVLTVIINIAVVLNVMLREPSELILQTYSGQTYELKTTSAEAARSYALKRAKIIKQQEDEDL